MASPEVSTPPLASVFSSLGIKYEEAYVREEGLARFLADLLQKLPPGARVLDLGCGTGKPVAATLAAAGHHVTGIDAADTMVALSREAVPPPGGAFEVADMRTYDPPGGPGPRFDAVLCILSLFGLTREEVEDLAGRWARWLRPGGLFGVCRIAAEDLHPPVESRGGRWDEDGLCARDITVRFMGNEYKNTMLTREGWRVLLESKGFALEKTFTMRYTPPPDSGGEPEDHYFILARLKDGPAQNSIK